MSRRYASLIVLSLSIGAGTVVADDPRTATLPETKDVATLERTPPSVERNLVAIWLKLPKLHDRTPLEATVVVIENGREVEIREMFPYDPQIEGFVGFGRGCNRASILGESVVRLRERNHVSGKIETIDLPLIEAIEIEKPKPANAR